MSARLLFMSKSQFNYLFTLKNAHLSSNSYNFRMQPIIPMKFAVYVTWILLFKHCKFGEKIYYNSGDIEFFLGDYFFGAPCSCCAVEKARMANAEVVYGTWKQFGLSLTHLISVGWPESGNLAALTEICSMSSLWEDLLWTTCSNNCHVWLSQKLTFGWKLTKNTVTCWPWKARLNLQSRCYKVVQLHETF